jgi:hypothetical protein
VGGDDLGVIGNRFVIRYSSFKIHGWLRVDAFGHGMANNE